MQTYYAQIPGSEAPTAEISASSTKHARTVYLDYLSRNGIIDWKDRQATRDLVKVSRMEPGEIRTQVQLDYDMRPEPEAVIEEAPTADVDAGEFTSIPSEPQSEHLGRLENLSEVENRVEEKAVSPSTAVPSMDSPITRLSRKSRGV